jgi:DNA-binding NarL/FixJ family response regulator
MSTLSELREKSWILLVDDEESIRNAVSRLFVNKGYHHVTTCADGIEAMEVAMGKSADQHDNTRVPDCIVSDVRMPEMDGIELLRSIRNNNVLCKVPVILLTAKGMTNDRIAGFDSGADAYLSKPFDPEELVAIVDNLIQRQAALSKLGAKVTQNPNVEDLKRDLDEIKNLLLYKGGGGVGNGWVKQTNVVLSSDERQVLELLSAGLMNKEIAAATHLSTRRIEQLLTQMYRKAGVKNRTELVRWAVSSGNVE